MTPSSDASNERYHSLDALRAFSLTLGIALHAAMSFMPGKSDWAAGDFSRSLAMTGFVYVVHIFRMAVFFLMAGFFGRLVLHRKGLDYLLHDRFRRIVLPMIGGWFLIFPFIGWAWIWGQMRDGSIDLPESARQLPSIVVTIGWVLRGQMFTEGFSVTHLWFLYYLVLFYIFWLALRFVTQQFFDRDGRVRLRWERWIAALGEQWWGVFVLAAPVFLGVWLCHDWFGIRTPERTLVPHPGPFLAYFSFFAFGWLIHRRVNILVAWSRNWRRMLAAGVLLTLPLWQQLQSHSEQRSLAMWAPGQTSILYSYTYALAMWLWVLGLAGLFLRFFSAPRPLVRYFSDSSYWLYVAHLPLIAFLQVAFSQLPWPWFVKFPLINFAGFAVLLLSYHYLIRSTWIGVILNGRRRPRRWNPMDISNTRPIRLEL